MFLIVTELIMHLHTFCGVKMATNQRGEISCKSTYGCSLIYGLDDEFLIIERNVPNFTPGKSNLWSQSERYQKSLSEIVKFLLSIQGDSIFFPMYFL